MAIKKLSPLVANQIAAGEVVDRPASVVKELLENAVDAGAQRIQIDIERGGTRIIRVSDDGCGIPKQELQLALARHATSKVELSSDLKAIHTLGFRGEALASISSVSRLTLSSKPAEQELGWSAYAEGEQMQVQIQPASIPHGTIIEVKDLFFNTPARQKFLRAERTEYLHIEEVVKRLALSSLNVAITLKHNGKVTKRIPAANNFEQQKQRVASIISNQFIGKALYLDAKIESLQLAGWVSPIELHQNSSLDQYVFINARVVKDKMLNHAIRQAYQGLLPPGRMPSYVLYLTIDAEKVDVNVHPTKHEVRFTDSRTVHDFIEKVIVQSLHNNLQASVEIEGGFDKADKQLEYSIVGARAYPQDDYYHSRLAEETAEAAPNDLKVEEANKQYAVTNVAAKKAQSWSQKSRGNGALLAERFYFSDDKEKLLLLDVKAFCLANIKQYLQQQWVDGTIKQKPLLIPCRMGLPQENLPSEIMGLWQKLGFDFSQSGPQSLILRKIPSCIEHLDFKSWLQEAVYKGLKKKIKQAAEWQRLLLDSLEDYWLPERKINWKDYLNSFSWQKSRFCKVIEANDFAKLIFASSQAQVKSLEENNQ